jgi:Tfp pilus assembly protein PilN
LDQVAERSQNYLRLGHGNKSLAKSVVPLDARHQHALTTVTNERTLEALLKAAAAARFEIDRIESSTVALCRCLGSRGHDAEHPVLIVNLAEREVGLLVSFRGRLLLEYRPGGRDVQDQLPTILQNHLLRIERYSARACGLTDARIRKLYLCGPDQALGPLREALSRETELIVEVAEPAKLLTGAAVAGEGAHATVAARATLAAEVNCDDAKGGSESCAAVGTCLAAVLPEGQAPGPNLMETIRAAHQEPLGRLVRRTFWPAAAALLVVAGTCGMAAYERVKLSSLEQELAKLEPQRARVLTLKNEMIETHSTIRALEDVRQRLAHVPQDKLLLAIAQCLPADVWLERVEVDRGMHVKLRGTSFGDESVFEFARWLGKTPGLTQVQLEGTTATQLSAGPATKFEVKFDLVNGSEWSGGNESSNGNTPAALPGDTVPTAERHNPHFERGSLGDLAGRR